MQAQTYKQTQTQVATLSISEKKMQLYFFGSRFPGGAIGIVVAGVVSCVVGIFLGLAQTVGGAGFFLLLGILLITGGSIYWSHARKSIPTDEEFDKWDEDQQQVMFQRAVSKLRLEGKIIGNWYCIRSFVLPDSVDAKDYEKAKEDEYPPPVKKVGKDGLWRCSVTFYTFFLPLKYRLCVFKTNVNALHQAFHDDEIHDFFYDQISGVTRGSIEDTIPLQDKGDDKDTQCKVKLERCYLKMVNSDKVNLGASFSVKLDKAPKDKSKNSSFPKLPDTDISLTIDALFTLIEEGKRRNRSDK